MGPAPQQVRDDAPLQPAKTAPEATGQKTLDPATSAVLAAPPAHAPLTAPSLLRLQSLAGNGAVAALLQRSKPAKPASIVPPAGPAAGAGPGPAPASAVSPGKAVAPTPEAPAEALTPNLDDAAITAESLASAPPRSPDQAEALLLAGYEAEQERARVQSLVAMLTARGQASQRFVMNRSGQQQQAITHALTSRKAEVMQAASQQRRQISASFGSHRLQLQAGINAEKAAVSRGCIAAFQSIEAGTTTRVTALTADIEQRRSAMHERLEYERQQPAVILETEAARAERDVAAGVREARQIGETEAAKYGDDEVGQAQSSAARKVAAETADDMAPKGPAIAKELRGQVHEYAGKLQQFGGGLDQQLTDALPHMTHLLQEEAAAAVSQVRVTNEAALNQLDAQAATARQHLDAEQQHALARVDAVRASSIRHLSTLAHQAQATLETAAQSRCSELDAHLQAVTSQLLAAESPDPQAVDEAVANASIYLAAGVADFDAQADRATTATRLGLEQAAAGTATVLTTVATNVATQDQRAVSGVLGQARASGQAAVAAAQQIVAALALHQQAIVAEGLAGIDELIAKGLAEPARLNEESRSNAGRTATEAIAKAREPLAALPANVKAAADKAKAEHERSLFAKIATGIGKALLGIVVGLVIVIALALVVAFIAGFFGVALTAFGAMMIAGGILLLAGAIFAFYKRHTDPETAKLGIGAQIKFALADVTGVTALCEGIFNQDVVTGKELNLDAEQRSERVTTGTLSIVMLILGARGLKAAPYTRPIGLPAFSFSSGLAGARGVGAEMWSTGLLAAKAGKEWFASAFKRLTAPRPIPADAVPLARPIKPGDVVTPDRITAGGPDTGAPATDSAKDAVPDKDPAGAGKSAPKSTAELAKSVRDAAKARGDPVGLKKAEYIERASSKLLTDNLKADFFARVKAKLDADPAKLPWDAMKDVVAENPTAFLYKGDVIPPDVIEQHGGMARGVDVDSVWSHMLKDEVKAPYRAHAQAEVSGGRDATAGDIFDELDARAKALWLDELRKDPSIFDLGKCKPNAVLTNPKAPGWWIPRDEFGQFSLVELIVDMALKADVYRPGMIVFTVDAGATGAASFHLPTPLDGIAFGEWGEAPPSSVFGVTEGGLPEAVAPPKIDVSMVKPGNIQVFPPSGPIAAPAAVGAGGSADAVQDVLGNRKPAGVR